MSTRTQSKSRHWRRFVSALMLTGAGALVFATWPTAANADPAVQVGWWNTASGGGQSAPDPTAPAGGMHIAVAPGEILAYGAVLYNLAPDATATLELKLSAQGTPVLQACPTKDVSWKPGDDQSADTAPAYDCSLHSYTGSISSDGATATFLVDGSADAAPGKLSLAILPYMTHDAPGGVGTELPVDSTTPFSVDVTKPDVSSLTVTSLPTVPTPKGGGGNRGGAAQQPTTPQSTGTGTSTSTGTGTSTTPTVSVPNTSQVNASTDAGTTPQVASPSTTTAQTPMQPAAAGTTPASGSSTAHNAALALLVLVAMLVVASSTPTMQRTPRLLGGAGRHAAGAAAATAAAAAPAVPMTLLGVRGLGRFAKPRNDVPRPLV